VHLSDFILQQTVFFRREAMASVGFLDETLHYGMDWDILIRIGLRQPLVFIPQYLACIRIHKGAKTATGGMGRWKELHAMLSKHTGMRLPPGSIVYGAEPSADLFSRWLGAILRGPLRLLAGPLQKSIRSGAIRWAGRAIQKSQGLYADGWAGRVLHYMLPPGGREIIIAGRLPGLGRLHMTQSLKIECNGCDLGTHSVPTGEFQIRVGMPDSLSGMTLRLKILAARSFTASRLGLSHDSRRLAYQLTKIRWA
jgi:hypothetical protein